MNIGFIGAGKVGFCLGQYLDQKNQNVIGYYSRSTAPSKEAAELTHSKSFESVRDLIAKSDLIFLTVPDGLIGSVWAALPDMPMDGKIFAHCSGSLSTDVFVGIGDKGAYAVSLHPLMAIPDKYQSQKLLGEAVFSVEGDPLGVQKVTDLVKSLGNEVYVLDKAHKTLYHCAASFVSNFSVALAYVGAKLFSSCGLGQAQGALFKLMLNNAKSISEYGPIGALTGPVERGDTGTVKGHLDVLSAGDRQLYRLLALKLTEVSKLKHPEKDYADLIEVLKND
jgi:predicted short-subunit dehydrogenase-like oxidoreductase (DUF2520 family)